MDDSRTLPGLSRTHRKETPLPGEEEGQGQRTRPFSIWLGTATHRVSQRYTCHAGLEQPCSSTRLPMSLAQRPTRVSSTIESLRLKMTSKIIKSKYHTLPKQPEVFIYQSRVPSSQETPHSVKDVTRDRRGDHLTNPPSSPTGGWPQQAGCHVPSFPNPPATSPGIY